jgi:hypothetical protein
MRLHSTEESYARGEISFLALIETVVAVVAVLAVSGWIGNLWYIAFWSLIGWTLLLRTGISTDRGLKLFSRFFTFCSNTLIRPIASYVTLPKRLRAAVIILAFVPLLLYFIVLIIGTLVIKVYATVSTLLFHPIQVLRMVPENWIKAIACLDIAKPLELVPGTTEHLLPLLDKEPVKFKVRLADVRYTTLWNEFRQPITRVTVLLGLFCSILIWLLLVICIGNDWNPLHIFDFSTFPAHLILRCTAMLILIALSFIIPALLMGVLLSPFRLLLYAPAYAYRLSLKTTAITYFPLLLIIQQSVSELPVKIQYEYVRNSRYAALRRFFAWVFGLLIVLKIVIYSLEVRFGEWWNASPLRSFLVVYISPAEMPYWQWATLFNSSIVLLFYYFADYMLFRMNSGQYVHEGMMLGVLRCVIVITGFLSLYSLAANVYIILHHQPFIRIPRLGPLWPSVH